MNFLKDGLMDGERNIKFRACEMSNLAISVEIYKKLYYNLPKDLKESIQKRLN